MHKEQKVLVKDLQDKMDILIFQVKHQKLTNEQYLKENDQKFQDQQNKFDQTILKNKEDMKKKRLAEIKVLNKEHIDQNETNEKKFMIKIQNLEEIIKNFEQNSSVTKIQNNQRENLTREFEEQKKTFETEYNSNIEKLNQNAEKIRLLEEEIVKNNQQADIQKEFSQKEKRNLEKDIKKTKKTFQNNTKFLQNEYDAYR